MRQAVLLGKLDELELLNGHVIRPRGIFLGHFPGRRGQLILIRKTCRPGGKLNDRVKRAHRKFHNSEPTKAAIYEWPDPVGRKRNAGRLVSLTYRIPKGMESPIKDKAIWHHEFGDHGERGHGPVVESGNYPVKLMPMLQEDGHGNLYIKRMPGNRYYVDEWIMW